MHAPLPVRVRVLPGWPSDRRARPAVRTARGGGTQASGAYPHQHQTQRPWAAGTRQPPSGSGAPGAVLYPAREAAGVPPASTAELGPGVPGGAHLTPCGRRANSWPDRGAPAIVDAGTIGRTFSAHASGNDPRPAPATVPLQRSSATGISDAVRMFPLGVDSSSAPQVQQVTQSGPVAVVLQVLLTLRSCPPTRPLPRHGPPPAPPTNRPPPPHPPRPP